MNRQELEKILGEPFRDGLEVEFKADWDTNQEEPWQKCYLREQVLGLYSSYGVPSEEVDRRYYVYSIDSFYQIPVESGQLRPVRYKATPLYKKLRGL